MHVDRDVGTDAAAHLVGPGGKRRSREGPPEIPAVARRRAGALGVRIHLGRKAGKLLLAEALRNAAALLGFLAGLLFGCSLFGGFLSLTLFLSDPKLFGNAAGFGLSGLALFLGDAGFLSLSLLLSDAGLFGAASFLSLLRFLGLPRGFCKPFLGEPLLLEALFLFLRAAAFGFNCFLTHALDFLGAGAFLSNALLFGPAGFHFLAGLARNLLLFKTSGFAGLFCGELFRRRPGRFRRRSRFRLRLRLRLGFRFGLGFRGLLFRSVRLVAARFLGDFLRDARRVAAARDILGAQSSA